MTFLGKRAEEKFSLKQNLILLAGLVVLLLILNSVGSLKDRNFAFADAVSLSGYIWSDNIGWISLSCSNTSSCGTVNYGLSIETNSKLSGYAWSDNIGWITANESELSGCPQTPCMAKINGTALNGWLRALSYGGGWDGWISLSGSQYGVTQSGGGFTGYAWGNDVVGWLDFAAAIAPPQCVPSTVYTCSGQNIVRTVTDSFCQTTITDPYATCAPPSFCSAGSSTCLYPQPEFVTSPEFTGHLQLVPTLLSSGDTTQVHWNINNVTSCTVTGTNGQSWSGASAGCDGTSCYSGATGKTSSPIISQTTYTLTCNAYPGVTPPTISESETVNIIPVFQEF